jgi:hypothetical protein
MTSQTKQADALKVFVFSVGLWLFITAGLIGASQATADEYEPPTFVTWPEKGLGLSIDLAGFKKEIDEIKPDGRRYLMASSPKIGLNVSITLEKVPTQALAQGCIDQLKLIQKGPLATRGQDVGLDIAGKPPTLEYTLYEFEGVRVNQKNMYTCLAEKDVYADIHLSKAQYTQADAAFFQSILKSARLQSSPSDVKRIQAKLPPPIQIPATPQPKPQPQIQLPPPEPPSSRELLDLGNALYLKNKYSLAILPYQKAFDLEKANPELDRTQWRVLIDNLGRAYVMTGRLKEARSTLEQGIQTDPTYPMFHYNLACVFAEMNDLDHTMQSLTTAFRHRKNLNPSDKSMPNPRQDSSFQRFIKNEPFQNLVNELTATKS